MDFSLILVIIILCLMRPASSNQPPKFINFRTSYFVNEDTPVGHTLGQLQAEDSDNTELEFTIAGEVAKHLLNLSRVDDTTMDINLQTPLDRETAERYDLVFEVRDGQNTIQKSSVIYVNDVNDNLPSFQNLPYRAEISEDAPPNTPVFQVTATDPDGGIWGLVSYNITTPQNLFEISTATGEVTLKGQLDYETEKFYQLEIMAVDGGGLFRTTDLVINVLDIQDAAPFFLNLPYMKAVQEDVQLYTSILQVSALDGDRGVANPVEYSFISGDPNESYFELNTTTGVITIARPLNREDPPIRDVLGVLEFTVQTVEITDNPQGSTSATAPVTITILDVNDQQPTFNQVAYQATVQENTQARIPVSFLPFGTEMSVKDYDQRDNGRFELLLVKDGQPFDVFDVVPQRVLNEATVLIKVKDPSALDYEVTQSISFQILAREYLTPEAFQSQVNVTVNIEDINDNLPEFPREVFNFSIPENPSLNTYVGTVTATDEDSGTFGDLRYSIRGASAYLFRVDSVTGEIFVAVEADRDWSLLDREKLDTHYITLEAVDGGGLRASAQLEIALSDVNDNAPDIARSYYEGYVEENEATLERTVQIQAIDLDLDQNAQITFTIDDPSAMRNFSINPDTGEVILLYPLDYEAMDPGLGGVIRFVVLASDNGSPRLASSVSVLIQVEDINDEVPYFQNAFYQSIIAENSTGGKSVATVSAHDDDITSPNNDVIYRIESGARDKFRIDAQTGLISVETGADLDLDRYGRTYYLRVLAIDRGTPPRTGSTGVGVTISDINNKIPVFEPNQYKVKIPEDLPVDSVVYTYTASDLDDSAALWYNLLDEKVVGEDENKRPVNDIPYLQSLFGINRSNGSVFVKSTLNREVVEEITITLFVEDLSAQQPPLQNNTAKLTIVLEDVNDNPPAFVPDALYRARISEASQAGVEVKQVLAVDPDKNSGLVSYYIVQDSAMSGYFEITDENRQTGSITLLQPVDHETYPWMNITVRAVDSALNPLSSLAQVNIEIEDVNDNSPEWISFPSPMFVTEDAEIGDWVTTVAAMDKDSGEFGRVMYFITSGNMGKFQINNETGEITVSGPLDREDVPEYSLTIEARDNNLAPPTKQRKTPAYMVIRLNDVNDFTPRFEKTFYKARNIHENVPVGHQVASPRAVDYDLGANGQIQYSIDRSQGNSSDLFRVLLDSGTVLVNKLLKGNVGWFHLVVIARDMGNPQLQNMTNVYVRILDVNDHKPQIVQPPENYTVLLRENVPIGHEVAQIKAIDLDEGINGQVRYMINKDPSSPNQDWRYFNLNETNGNLTTSGMIDREMQDIYFLEIQVYDRGVPSYDDSRTIKIMVTDEDDNPPLFNHENLQIPLPVRVSEESAPVYVDNLHVAEDSDSGNNSVICYYIIGGDMPFKNYFYLNKTSGDLSLYQPIDREKTPSVNLIIKASDDCWTSGWEIETNRNQVWNASDSSLLWVEVEIEDINDNPPRFLKNWFTAGVTRETQFKEEVLSLADYTIDADDGPNSAMMFSLKPPIHITEPLKTQLRQRGEENPFRVLPDGTIITNIYFQQNMQGYFSFQIYVNDSSPTSAFYDIANVSIYLLNENQRAKVIIRGTPQEVGQFKDHFSEYLSNITGRIINVDMIRTHQDADGKPNDRRVDMFIHAINKGTGEVLDAKELIDLIDSNYQSLVELFNSYNVIEIVQAVDTERASLVDKDLRLALILVACILFVLLVIMCITFFTCRRKYKRKLKAATAMAFENHNHTGPGIGSNNSGLNRLEMPGTNLHTYEGSNPIWLEQYENGWPKESDTDSKNSLDENAVEATAQMKTYDEQEMSMEMYNDEYDHFNKMPPAKLPDSDLYLQAAINEHDTMKRHNSNNFNHLNHSNKKTVNGKPKLGNGPPAIYDNYAYSPEESETRHIDGMITTDI